MRVRMTRKLFAFLVAVGLVALGVVSMSSVYAEQTSPRLSMGDGAAPLVNVNGAVAGTPTPQGAIRIKDLPAIGKSHGAPHAPEAALDGEMWSQLNYGVSGIVYAIAANGNDVYVGGDFDYVCNNADCTDTTQVNNIAKWNGIGWAGVGNGFSGTVYSITVHDDDIYVGGAFSSLCGNVTCSTTTAVNNAARWDGSSWHAVGYGFNGSVRVITFLGNNLYAGGFFEKICGAITCVSGSATDTNYIAKWNGTKWVPMGKGFSSGVKTLALRNTIIYAGGSFENICGNADCDTGNQKTNYLAQWNGSAWSPVVFGVSNDVNTLLARDDYLFIGGDFHYICQDAACNASGTINYIAAWDGTTWYRVAYGLNSDVNDIVSYGNDLYATGAFFRACDSLQCFFETRIANRVAKWSWDTGEWEPFTNGVFDTGFALAITNNTVYVGGDISQTSSNEPIALKNIGQYGPITFVGPTFTPTATRTNTPLVSPTPTQTATNTPTMTPTVGACVSAPAKPTLTAPANNSTTTKTRVTLKWNAVACATSYNVTVKPSGGGSGDSKAGLAATQYKTKTLAKGKTYKWTVQACNTQGCTKSKAFKFTIQ